MYAMEFDIIKILTAQSAGVFSGWQYTFIDSVQGPQQFCWPENGSIARSCRQMATNPFEGQLKLLLFVKSVFITVLLYTILWRQYHVTYRSDENKAIGQSSIAGNRSMNCWPVNRTVFNFKVILLLTVKMYLYSV